MVGDGLWNRKEKSSRYMTRIFGIRRKVSFTAFLDVVEMVTVIELSVTEFNHRCMEPLPHLINVHKVRDSPPN